MRASGNSPRRKTKLQQGSLDIDESNLHNFPCDRSVLKIYSERTIHCFLENEFLFGSPLRRVTETIKTL